MLMDPNELPDDSASCLSASSGPQNAARTPKENSPMSMQADTQIDLNRIRSAFPALNCGVAFLENAGGSQVPACVADSIREYMLNTYVQLGAGYPISNVSTETVEAAHQFMNRFMNGESKGLSILGSSTTSLCRILAECYADILAPGDEIILAETAHEANFGPWERMAERVGWKVRHWRIDPDTYGCPIESLDKLFTERTRLVAFPHVSNLLGEIVDVQAITAKVHEAGARVVVDGVAYAPHRAIDVDAWDVDWYAFSSYKVYGPHMATLYGRHDAIDELTGPNHFFIPKDEVPYKFEPGGPSHEGCAGILALGRYLSHLADSASEHVAEMKPGAHQEFPDRATIERAFDVMTTCELSLQEMFIDFLRSKPKIRIIGPNHAEESRVATMSFVHDDLEPTAIVDAVHQNSNIGIRFGHMYAYRLCKAIGLEPESGVVRVSAVHYNTPDEIEMLMQCLEPIVT